MRDSDRGSQVLVSAMSTRATTPPARMTRQASRPRATRTGTRRRAASSPSERSLPKCSADPRNGVPERHGKPFDVLVDTIEQDILVRGLLRWTVGQVTANTATADPWIGLPSGGIHLV